MQEQSVEMIPFVAETKPPLMDNMLAFYQVSGEPVGEVEPIQLIARLPFCLYLPPTQYLFSLPDKDSLIGLVPCKIWTDRAEGSTDLTLEPIAKGATTYLTDASVITESIGTFKPVIGGLKGRNVEFDKDSSGYFRRSRLTIETDWTFAPGFNPYDPQEGEASDFVKHASRWALRVANYVIDAYRVSTGDSYIRRLSDLEMEEIRIGIADTFSIRKGSKPTSSAWKCGYHPLVFSLHGLRPAAINKPAETVEEFRGILQQRARPESWVLLRMDAEAALDSLDTKTAVIESFVSLELFVEGFFRKNLAGKMTSGEIDELLGSDNNWRLAVRLKELLKANFGNSIASLNNKLWQEWLKAQDLRNDVVHRGVEPSYNGAKEVLDANYAVIQLMQELQKRL